MGALSCIDSRIFGGLVRDDLVEDGEGTGGLGVQGERCKVVAVQSCWLGQKLLSCSPRMLE